MNKKQWEKTVKKQIPISKDNIKAFQTTIKILSEMLEERDRIYQIYIDTGAQPVTEFTTDRGAVNLKPNPLLKQWQDINITALSYLRDLGLTAAGLKKITGIATENLKTENKGTSTEQRIMEKIRSDLNKR